MQLRVLQGRPSGDALLRAADQTAQQAGALPVCSRDPAGEGHKAAKERVRQEKLAKVAKVIGLSKLRSKYESHEAKRNLCAQYDIFLADDRIIPLLPKLIGGPSGGNLLRLLYGCRLTKSPY